MSISEFKDLFSTQSTDYARFRPTYPAELFRHLASFPVGVGRSRYAACSLERVVEGGAEVSFRMGIKANGCRLELVSGFGLQVQVSRHLGDAGSP